MTIFAKYARFIRTATTGAFMAATLAACGGGGGAAGTPANGGGTSPTTPSAVAKLVVELDKKTVPNSGAQTVDVKVTSTDVNGSAVGDVPMAFAVDSNAIITPAGTKSDSTGVLHATVSLGADRTNRTITVTAAATDGKNTILQKASFDVVDSLTGGKIADLSMTLNTQSIPYDGSATAALTITSLDANRTAVGGTPVTLSVVDPANTAFVTAANTTDATSGQLIATISVGASRTTRPVTVTAVSGTVSRSITLNIVTPPSTTPLAADMTLVLDKISIGNTGGDKVTATVTAVDAQRNVIAGIPVAFTTTDAGATVAVQNGTTNASGQAIATVNSGADKSNRLITVVATSGALTKTATFQVLGTKLVGTALPQQPTAGSTGNRIDYRLSDVNQNPMTFVPISVSAPGLPSASGQTDASGSYTFTYTAPATSGPIDITATAGGVSTVNTVTVPNSSSTVPTATPSVVSASVSANPTVVSVNTSTTSNRSEIRALFQAASNAPVKNVRVRFDLNGDANSIGGTLASGTQIVYSDTSGLATTSYSPGSRPSPTSGVTIRACWDYNDFAAGTCPNSVLTTLTVVSDPLSISIGTNGDVTKTDLTYRKSFVVLVVDAAGQPKADVQITPSLDLVGYYKGFYSNTTTANWTAYYYLDSFTSAAQQYPQPFPLSLMCLAEDVNRNGLIDGVEDQNGNKQLDPRKSDASISMSGSTRTDANGQAVLVLEYPQSVASWVRFQLSASALGVLSPPATYNDVLPVDAASITDSTRTPAFVVSPYGRRRVAADGSFCKNAD